jgi:TPR repeat protein
VRLLSRSSEAASADESAGFQLLDFAPDPLGAVGSEAPKIAALKERAAAGDVVAMRELGLGYRFGEGVSRDTAAAASWLKFAAEAGDAEAMYWYGQCLGAGEGVEADPFEGMQWISRSAQSGYEPAQRWIEQTRQEVVADAVGSILSALADQAAFGDFSSEPAYDEAAAQREWEYRRQQQADYWNNRAEQAEAFGNRDEAERYRRYAE